MTPDEAQLDKKRREEREEWSVPRQDGAFDWALRRFVADNRADGRGGCRQRCACEICERRQRQRHDARIAIAAAGHRRMGERLRFVASVE